MEHYSFDLDGTLVDSLPLMEQSWRNVKQKLGVDVDWLDYKKHIGLSFSDICKNLGLSDFETDIRETYFSFNLENQHLIKAMPGLDALLEKLSKVHSWSIVTSKPIKTASPIIEAFGMKPNLILTPDALLHGKPSVEASLILRSKFDCEAFVYVGDTITDHLFAINSGFEFIRFKSQDASMAPDAQAYDKIMNSHRIVSDLSFI